MKHVKGIGAAAAGLALFGGVLSVGTRLAERALNGSLDKLIVEAVGLCAIAAGAALPAWMLLSGKRSGIY